MRIVCLGGGPGIPTIAVGNISDAAQVNRSSPPAGQKLCAIGRPHLSDPLWTLHAAAALGYDGVTWPRPYERGRQLPDRSLQRAAQLALGA
jgi:anthraniloyl-CoA monooxygenase